MKLCIYADDVLIITEFSCHFRTQIISFNMNSSRMVTIYNLPEEVMLQIFKWLPYRDLLSAGRTCKQLHRVSKDDNLLKKIVQTEFKNFDQEDYSEEQFCLAVYLGNMSLKLRIKRKFSKL